jgi:hypothetical protein
MHMATRRPIRPLLGQFSASWPFAVIALVSMGSVHRSRVHDVATIRRLPLRVERRPQRAPGFCLRAENQWLREENTSLKPELAIGYGQQRREPRRELRQARGLPAEREDLVGRLSD